MAAINNKATGLPFSLSCSIVAAIVGLGKCNFERENYADSSSYFE
jgi:phosphate/sulfate permease